LGIWKGIWKLVSNSRTTPIMLH